jgi:hypothetical protein
MSLNRIIQQKRTLGVAFSIGTVAALAAGLAMLAIDSTLGGILAGILVGSACTPLALWVLFLVAGRNDRNTDSQPNGPQRDAPLPSLSDRLTLQRVRTSATEQNPFQSPIEFEHNGRARFPWGTMLWSTAIALGVWSCLLLVVGGITAARWCLIEQEHQQTQLASQLAAEANRLLVAALIVFCLIVYAWRKMKRHGGAKRGQHH